LSAAVDGASVRPDGRLAVDLSVRCDEELGSRLAHCAIGVRERRRLTTWVSATPSVRDLPANETIRVRLEAPRPTSDAADRLFLYVSLESDRGSIELGADTIEQIALAVTTTLAAVGLWVLVGPASAAAAFLLGSLSGWRAARFNSRPETRRWSGRRLVRFWPAAALAAAIGVFELAGGESDASSHAYGTHRAVPVALALLAVTVLFSVSRRGPLYRLRVRFRDIEPTVRLAVLLALGGTFMALAPSTTAAKLATQAFCRRQASLPTVSHRRGHISEADVLDAYARLPDIRISRRRLGPDTAFTFITADGKYSLGDLVVYRAADDAEGAYSLRGISLGQPPAVILAYTLVQNVLLDVSKTDPAREMCTLVGRLRRLDR